VSVGKAGRVRWTCPLARRVEHDGCIHRQGRDCSDPATKEEKRKLVKKKMKEKMRKQSRKPICTQAWGRGIDRVGRSYPNPYPGQVYPVPGRVTRTPANPYA